MSATSHQTHVETAIADRNKQLLQAAAPKAAAQAAALAEKAGELAAEADAAQAEHVRAMRRIETLLAEQRKLTGEITHLNELRASADYAEANGRQALAYHCAAADGDPYAGANFSALADQMLRVSIVLPFIPAMVKERETALEQARAEVSKLADAHDIDVAALTGALRAPRH